MSAENVLVLLLLGGTVRPDHDRVVALVRLQRHLLLRLEVVLLELRDLGREHRLGRTASVALVRPPEGKTLAQTVGDLLGFAFDCGAEQ